MVILLSRHPCMKDNHSYNFALLLTQAECSVVLNVFLPLILLGPVHATVCLLSLLKKGKSQTPLLSLNICVWKTECGLDIAFLFLSKEAREISLNEHTGAKDKTIIIFLHKYDDDDDDVCLFRKKKKSSCFSPFCLECLAIVPSIRRRTGDGPLEPDISLISF